MWKPDLPSTLRRFPLWFVLRPSRCASRSSGTRNLSEFLRRPKAVSKDEDAHIEGTEAARLSCSPIPQATVSPFAHRDVPSPRRHGRILGVKFGVNPNSSSIGSDLSVLLIGAAGLTLVVNVLDALLRGRFFKKNDAHGEGSGGNGQRDDI